MSPSSLVYADQINLLYLLARVQNQCELLIEEKHRSRESLLQSHIIICAVLCSTFSLGQKSHIKALSIVKLQSIIYFEMLCDSKHIEKTVSIVKS